MHDSAKKMLYYLEEPNLVFYKENLTILMKNRSIWEKKTVGFRLTDPRPNIMHTQKYIFNTQIGEIGQGK